MSGIASAASFIPSNNDLSRQLADQNQAYFVNQQQQMQNLLRLSSQGQAFHFQSVAEQQARTRAESFELRVTSQIRDEELAAEGGSFNNARKLRGLRKSAGALPVRFFMRTAAPARREPLRYRNRRVGGIVAHMGKGGSTFSFGRGFEAAPGSADRSFQFGNLSKGAPSFSFGGLAQ